MRSSEGDPALRDEVHSRLLAGERKLVLDLREVPVIDSMTITEVVVCHKRARNAGADTRVVLNPRGREVFEITRLHLVLDLYGDVDSALGAFAGLH
jgi:anti-anti-sigma regulatory factor